MAAFSPINKFIVVDRENFKLTLYKRPITTWKFRKEDVYHVAVGATGYETPRGLYLINSRAKHPDWLIPDSRWATDAGLTPGTILSGDDPNNPIKQRWLGITDPTGGVGIHGTANIGSIGTAASHGCIRMRPYDVVKLYRKVPKYTPIYIV